MYRVEVIGGHGNMDIGPEFDEEYSSKMMAIAAFARQRDKYLKYSANEYIWWISLYKDGTKVKEISWRDFK